MPSIARRATPRQAMVMRMIVGAVKNAADAHPSWWNYDRRLAHSIAKRAAGTLTAGWPDVLALPLAASDSGSGLVAGRPYPSSAQVVKRVRRGSLTARYQRSPLLRAQNAIGFLAGRARRVGQIEREAALVEALKIIGGMLRD